MQNILSTVLGDNRDISIVVSVPDINISESFCCRGGLGRHIGTV